MMNRAKIAIAFLVASACSDAPKTAEDSAAAAQAVAEKTIADQKADLIPKGESASTAAPTPPAPAEKTGGEWDVTFSGIGPLKAGMSLDEAKIVMHNNLDIPAKLDECAMIRTRTGPKGILIMVEKNEISRIDVTSGTVATVDGAKIGSTEDQIKSLYPGQVEVQPHKYTSGHYLVVTPKNGGETRLVFETDGNKVLRYRSGRMPAVQYVESCA